MKIPACDLSRDRATETGASHADGLKDKPPGTTLRVPVREVLFVYFLTLALTVALQWHNRSFESEFTTASDESAHYVTGLMLHDYILHGFPENPLVYATRYYEHYPRVALGQWPPVFYVVQALWTIPFGVSRLSVLVLMAAIGGALLTTTYILSNRYFPRWLSAALTVFLASLRSFQSLSSALMSEVLVALLVLWSVMVFEQYLRSPRRQTAVGFALLAAAAILTKGTGLALAPIPLAAAVFNNDSKPYRHASFWLAAALIAVICAPWFLLVPGALHERVAKFGGIVFQPYRPVETLQYFVRELSLSGLILAAVGMIIVFVKKPPNRSTARKSMGLPNNTFWMLGFLLFLSTLALRTFIGAWEDRHLVTLLPVFTLFMGIGICWIVNVGFAGGRAATFAAILTITCVAAINIANATPKQHIGLDAVAEDLVSDSRFRTARFLIASDSVGEGVFVAEVAMREPRPGHIVERGSKVLASDGFMGDHYQIKYPTPSDLMKFLEAEPEELVVLDTPKDSPKHVQMLRETMVQYKDRWDLVASYLRTASTPGDGAQIQVYALKR